MPSVLEIALALIGSHQNDGPEPKRCVKTVSQPSETAKPKTPTEKPALDDAAGWQDRFRHLREQYRGLGYHADVADGLAAGHTLINFHSALTTANPSDPECCAGCGEPIEGEAINFDDGARIHDGADKSCLLRYGEKWRKRAADGLKALGVPVPAHVGTLQ